ncbi:MAG: glycosyltransferase family 4 protein [Acidimicrobiales bacterium]
MRVVFAAWRDLAHPQAGGAEVLVDHLATGMAARGHEVAVMCGGPVAAHPYPVVDLGGTYGQYLTAPVVHRRRFADWDLLVDTENGVPFFSPLWRRRPVLCLVHHVHTEQWAQHFPPPVAAVGRGLERQVMPRVYRTTPFVAVSPSTAAGLAALGVPAGQITVAPLNGVDACPVPVEPDPEPLVVAMGRLVPHKRVDLLLSCWEEVRRRTGARLVVAGDGPSRAGLESSPPDGVEFLGRVTDDEKWALLARAWVLAHPALHEGWGAVILEAAAAGTPAVGFDVPGVRDAIVPGESGLLASSVGEFTDHLVDLLASPGRRRALADGATAQAARFGWDRAIDAFETVAEAARHRTTPSVLAEQPWATAGR